MNFVDMKLFISEENPFTYFINKKKLIYCQPIPDENGESLAICTDYKERKHVILYSGIN